MWVKEKLLLTSNFSFSYSVFKRLVLKTRKNQGLFGKELMHLQDPCGIKQAMTNFWVNVSCSDKQGDEHFPTRQNLDSSKLKEFEDDNIKFDENERKFSKRIDNTVDK